MISRLLLSKKAQIFHQVTIFVTSNEKGGGKARDATIQCCSVHEATSQEAHLIFYDKEDHAEEVQEWRHVAKMSPATRKC